MTRRVSPTQQWMSSAAWNATGQSSPRASNPPTAPFSLPSKVLCGPGRSLESMNMTEVESRGRLLKADRAGIRGADRSRGKNLSRRQPNATGRCHHDVAGRDEDVPLEGGRIRLFRRAAPERRKSESNNRQRSRSSPECSGVAG